MAGGDGQVLPNAADGRGASPTLCLRQWAASVVTLRPDPRRRLETELLARHSGLHPNLGTGRPRGTRGLGAVAESAHGWGLMASSPGDHHSGRPRAVACTGRTWSPLCAAASRFSPGGPGQGQEEGSPRPGNTSVAPLGQLQSQAPCLAHRGRRKVYSEPGLICVRTVFSSEFTPD